jgi:hypothetical protein
MSIRATHPNGSGLSRNRANYAPLTPISFPLRSSSVYPDRLGEKDYEAFLAIGDSSFMEMTPRDAWDAIALTGAYLNAFGNVLVRDVQHHPVYLCIPPMSYRND